MDSKVALKIREHWCVEGCEGAEDFSAIYFLEGALDDENEDVAEAAAEALARLAERSHPGLRVALEDAKTFAGEKEGSAPRTTLPPSLPVLYAAMGTSKGHVRHSVVRALTGIGDRVVPNLLEALTLSVDDVRICAAWALGEIGNPLAIPPLVQLLQDRNRLVSDCAIHALVRFGSSAVPLVVEALRDERSRRAAVEALGWIGDASATPALLDTMQSGNLDTPWATYDYSIAFERIGPKARPFVLEVLHDPYEFRRVAAVIALDAIGDENDRSLFVEALRDPGRYGHVRSRAAYALGRRREVTAVPALFAALEDRHEGVRAAAIEALGMYREMSFIPAIIQGLGDRRLNVQRAALDALTEWNDAARLALEHALLDPIEAVRVGAATALLRIQEDEDLPRRILLLPEVLSETKVEALEALRKAHHPIPTPAALCRDLIGDPDPAVRQATEDVLRVLERETAPPKPQPAMRFFGWKSQ